MFGVAQDLEGIIEHIGFPETIHTRKIAPIFFPSSELADRIVSVSSTIAHTPRALAMYGPSPRRWNSS